MNNAALFFPFEEEDDLYDLYEERLFEDKQFFLNRAILPSLFEKRMEKMLKREEAFRTLTDSEFPEVKSSTIDFPAGNTLSEAYSYFESEKAKLFQAIFSAKNNPKVVQLIRNLIELFTQYSAYLELADTFDIKDVLLSKDPEPVTFSMAVHSFEKAGGQTIEDLQQLTFDGKETILNEAKRLSLWRKKELKNGSL